MTIEAASGAPGQGATPSPALPVATMVALAVVGALGPLSTDLALPALPQIARDLSVSESSVRWILSAVALGLASGQLVVGSLSDRLGRRRLMSWGALVAAVAAFAASTAPTLAHLIIACAVLGFSAAAGIVTGRAHIADTSVGVQASRRFTVLQLCVSVAPIVGPVAGAALLTVGDWRTVFLALSAFAVVGTVAVLILVPESLGAQHRRARSLAATVGSWGGVLATPRYLAFASSYWFGFGMLFAYISTSSSILQTGFGLPSGLYAADFAVNGAGLVVTSLTAATLVHRIAPARIVVTGLTIQLATILALGAAQITSTASLPVVLVGLFLCTASMGLVLGPATSLAVAPLRDRAGTALALLGSLQFAAGGVAASLTAIIPAPPLTAFLLVGATSSLIALGAAILGRRTLTTARATAGDERAR